MIQAKILCATDANSTEIGNDFAEDEQPAGNDVFAL